MAVGQTAYYKTNSGMYTAMNDTGNDQGLISNGYTKYNNQEDYANAINQDLQKYTSLADQLNSSQMHGSNFYTYKNSGASYSGDDPLQRIDQLRQELSRVSAGQGIYSQGYNNGDQVVNGNYTTAGSIAQQNQFDQGVANGTMKVTGYANGTPIYGSANSSNSNNMVAYAGANGVSTDYPALGYGSPVSPSTVQAANKQLTFNPTENLTPGMSGDNVKQLQNYLISQGYNIPDGATGFYGDQTKAAVAEWQSKNGIQAGANAGFFGPLSRAYLAQNPATQEQAMGVSSSTLANGGVPTFNPNGTVSGTASLGLASGSAVTFPQLSGTGLSTADVMNQRQSYEDTINSYLKQQADAYAALQNTKATALQGTANIMYGLNGAGGHDANLQGAEQAMFDRQMAFQEVPAQIALGNAQNALALFKQSPAYLNETQARDTAFNLLQSYPDINYQYNPSLSAAQNLQAIKQALPSSTKYQTSLVNYAGYTDVNGVFHMYNKKDTGGTAPLNAATIPTQNNPNTAVGNYVPGSASPINKTIDVGIPTPKTKTQVSFVNDLSSGTLAKSKTALNTAIGHLFEADQLYPALGNGESTLANMTRNALNKLMGNSAASNYETAQTLASNELAAAYGGDSQADRAKLAQFGGAAQSPSQHKGYIETSTALLSSKLGAIAEQYKGAFGTYPPSLDVLVSPLNQVKLSQTGVNLNGIVPGMHVSPSTQAMINSAKIIGAKVYLPGSDGKYYPQQ